MATLLVKGVFKAAGQIVLVGEVQGDPLWVGMKAEAEGYTVQISKMQAERQPMPKAEPGETVEASIAKVAGPDELPPAGIRLFRKGRYFEAMKTLEGKVLMFESV